MNRYSPQQQALALQQGMAYQPRDTMGDFWAQQYSMNDAAFERQKQFETNKGRTMNPQWDRFLTMLNSGGRY